MDFFWLFPTALAVFLSIIAILLFQSRERAKRKAVHLEAALHTAQSQLEDRAVLQEKLDAAITAKHEAEKQAELVRQKLADQDVRMKDWEAQREESVKAAKAAILEAGGQMSSKLLEDHKREQEAHKKEQEKFLKETTGNLMQQYFTLTEAVANIKEQTTNVGSQVSTVMRSLTNPSGAGQLAEYGLENALKNLGLEMGRDFIMQHTVPGHEGGKLRPDAVVFLPNDVVMVVDCKASKFLVELAEAEETEADTEKLEKQLNQTMQKHLRDLSGKDYASAVDTAFKAQGHKGKVGMMLNIMYLPSESAWERLHKIDPDYRSKMDKANLIQASPSTLMGLFSLATLNIAEARQMSNHHEIIEATSGLLESVSVVMGHMDSIGNGLKNAMGAFDKAAKSANTRLLPRMGKLVKQGVKPARNKELPAPVKTYDVRRQDDLFIIDAEVEYAEERKKIGVEKGEEETA